MKCFGWQEISVGRSPRLRDPCTTPGPSNPIPGSFFEPLARSWSHFVGLHRQKLPKYSKLTFDGGSKGLAWITLASRHHVPLTRSRRSNLVNYSDRSDSAFSVTLPPIQSPSKITKLVVNDYEWFRAQGVDRAALADVCVVCGVWCVVCGVCGVWCIEREGEGEGEREGRTAPPSPT